MKFLKLAVLCVGSAAVAQQVWVSSNTLYLSSPDLGTNNNWSGGGQNPLTPGVVLDQAPKLWSAIYVNGVTVAGNVYGGEILPAASPSLPNLRFRGVRFRVAVSGTGGTDPFTIRVSDGTNDCDCGGAIDNVSCATSAGNYRLTCGGVCDFQEGVELTYSVSSIGDCLVGPDIQGNLQFEARYE